MDTGLLFAYIGVGIMVGMAGIGSAIGTATSGMATVGAIKKNKEAFGSCLVLSALPGTQGLYGFGAYFIMSQNITSENGFIIFGAGLAVGLACMLSAVFQGKVCASGVDAIGNGNDVFGNTIVMAVFPELYAIVAFATAFLLSGTLA